MHLIRCYKEFNAKPKPILEAISAFEQKHKHHAREREIEMSFPSAIKKQIGEKKEPNES